MTKNKSHKFTVKWAILLGVTLVFLVGLNVLKNNKKWNVISKEEAITKVKTLQEVKDYLKRVPSGLVLVNGQEDNGYMVQVYEVKNGHTATFNWYKVNKTTGNIKKEF